MTPPLKPHRRTWMNSHLFILSQKIVGGQLIRKTTDYIKILLIEQLFFAQMRQSTDKTLDLLL